MQYQDCSARRLFIALLAAPLLSPALAAADDAASLDHAGDRPTPRLAVTPGRAADVTFERQFGETFFRDYWALHPERAIAAGQFEFADRTLVLDARARAQAIGKLNAWLSQLHRFNPDTLSDANRSDWNLLNDTFEAERWALTEYRAWEWNPTLYNVTAPMAAILRADYAPLEQRLRAVLKRLNDVSTYYTTAKNNLSRPALDLTMRAIESHRQDLQVLGPELNQRVLASQLRDSEKALFSRRILAARIAIEDYIAWLQEMSAQPADGATVTVVATPALPVESLVDVSAAGTQAARLTQADNSSLVREFLSNSALTASWSTRQAQAQSPGNIRQSALQ